jgi:hypothetical protein
VVALPIVQPWYIPQQQVAVNSINKQYRIQKIEDGAINVAVDVLQKD